MALTVEGIRSSAQLVGNEVACMLSLLKSFFVARVQGGRWERLGNLFNTCDCDPRHRLDPPLLPPG